MAENMLALVGQRLGASVKCPAFASQAGRETQVQATAWEAISVADPRPVSPVRLGRIASRHRGTAHDATSWSVALCPGSGDL